MIRTFGLALRGKFSLSQKHLILGVAQLAAYPEWNVGRAASSNLHRKKSSSGCGAVGSVPAWGAGGREFESRHSDVNGQQALPIFLPFTLLLLLPMSISFKNFLELRLTKPLPGIDAQYEMAHIKRAKVRPEDLQAGTFRESAVLILLYEKEGNIFIPLTERHPYPGVHGAQISFPGGKSDPEDKSLEMTAFRECKEEIGVSENLQLLGALTPVYIPVSSFIVHPFVAYYTSETISFTLNEREVKSLVELNLEVLKKPATIKQTTVEPAPGLRIETPYFDVNGKVVWGATAMMLNELRHLLLEFKDQSR